MERKYFKTEIRFRRVVSLLEAENYKFHEGGAG